MMRRLKNFIKSERGDAIIAIPFTILIALILFLVAVSIYQYSTIKTNMKTAANEVLQLVKVENGADSSTRAKFNDLLTKMGMDPSLVTFQATPKLVQRGDQVEIVATREYNVFALKAIRVDYSVQIKVKTVGLAHKYIRDGGD